MFPLLAATADCHLIRKLMGILKFTSTSEFAQITF